MNSNIKNVQTRFTEEIRQVFSRNTAELRIPALLIEIDEELLILHKALEEKNEKQVKKSKEKLAKLSAEKFALEV